MPRLYVLSGRDLGRSFRVSDGALLGRGRQCDVTLRSASVSRRHARLERRHGRWFVVDLGSTNGVRKSGERVAAAPLEDLEEFHVGDLLLRFRLEDEPSLATTAGESAAPTLGEVVLEEEIDLVGTAMLRESAPSSGRLSARPLRAEPPPVGAEPGGSSGREDDLLRGDLEQRPLLQVLAIGLGLLALAAALGWGAFTLARVLRSAL